MSADEDTELRDLVAQTLESNGVLGKIRAQLRASVFLALEEQESLQNKTPFLNNELKKFAATKEGRLVISLVREFIEYFKLEYTLAVFDPETGGNDNYDGRSDLARELNVLESENSLKGPLLAEMVRRGAGGSASRTSVTDNDSTVESKNKKNLQQNLSAPSSKPTQFKQDHDFDPFFDKPLPGSDNTDSVFSDKGKEQNKSITKTKEESKSTSSAASTKPSNIPRPGAPSTGLSSLAGLPSLTSAENHLSPRSPDLADIKDIDKKIADLGFEVPEDDYEEDFMTSESISPRGHTPRSDLGNQTPRSDFMNTPRSDRRTKSIDENIEEDIDEDFSVAEDLLKDSQSAQDDLLTTDRTISPTDQNGGFDYMEDVLP